ncbi:MAG: hypothetical protein JW832_13805, partial [Deltaproteobacteria bacterium]|nr:hypothetical protein [Deltaproteobacteria bacterium]
MKKKSFVQQPAEGQSCDKNSRRLGTCGSLMLFQQALGSVCPRRFLFASAGLVFHKHLFPVDGNR